MGRRKEKGRVFVGNKKMGGAIENTSNLYFKPKKFLLVYDKGHYILKWQVFIYIFSGVKNPYLRSVYNRFKKVKMSRVIFTLSLNMIRHILYIFCSRIKTDKYSAYIPPLYKYLNISKYSAYIVPLYKYLTLVKYSTYIAHLQKYLLLVNIPHIFYLCTSI